MDAPSAVIAPKPDAAASTTLALGQDAAPTALAPKVDAPSTLIAPKPGAAAKTDARAGVATKPDAAVAKSKGSAAKPDADPRPKKPAVAKGDVQRGTLKLPSGAAASLNWSVSGTELRLTPELAAGAQVTHAFVLANPARAVFDLSGGVPARSHVVAASPPYATSVRLGKQGAGTRIVVDLDSAPKRSAQDGATLVLSF